MVSQKNKTARAVAIEVLNRCEPEKDYAAPILNKLLDRTSERQRATDLVFGTIRKRIAIDTVTAKFSGRRLERIPRKILNIIRIGIYELVYCPDTQEYAIVNEAVENAKSLAGKKQGGFVNAVLRNVARHITNRNVQLQQVGDKRTLIQNLQTGCEFDTDFLPDSKTHPDEYLSTVFSLPKWLVNNWLEEFGEEATRQICLASNRRPSIYLRPNTLKTTVQDLTEKLHKEGMDCEVVEGAMIKLKGPRAVNELPGFDGGLFVVQDITASQPVRLLDPKSAWTILDLCAAPGTKTTQLAEATCGSAKIIATDIDSRRLEMVKENAARLCIKSIEIVPYDKIPDSDFDCVLLDVPSAGCAVFQYRCPGQTH